MKQRKVKVWNKIVTIENVPDYLTDEELVKWTKKYMLIEELKNQEKTAS